MHDFGDRIKGAVEISVEKNFRAILGDLRRYTAVAVVFDGFRPLKIEKKE